VRGQCSTFQTPSSRLSRLVVCGVWWGGSGSPDGSNLTTGDISCTPFWPSLSEDCADLRRWQFSWVEVKKGVLAIIFIFFWIFVTGFFICFPAQLQVVFPSHCICAHLHYDRACCRPTNSAVVSHLGIISALALSSPLTGPQ
jgi:hypothetical protein